MKVLCKRNGVYVSIAGKSVELVRGVNEVPDEIGKKLITRGAVLAVENQGDEPVLVTNPDKPAKPAKKASSAKKTAE
jgi:hypothetical protein